MTSYQLHGDSDDLPLAERAHATRARVLAAGLIVETVVGLTYFFPIYSETLKRVYGLSNGAVQLIASVQNVGGTFGIHVGIFYDALGPRATVLLGLVIGGLGWGALWIALAYGLPAPFWVLVGLAFLQGHGQLVVDCAAVPTVAVHFPAEQYALALGLTKSLLGLSGSLAAQVRVGSRAPRSGKRAKRARALTASERLVHRALPYRSFTHAHTLTPLAFPRFPPIPDLLGRIRAARCGDRRARRY
jgi:hypothetical protein